MPQLSSMRMISRYLFIYLLILKSQALALRTTLEGPEKYHVKCLTWKHLGIESGHENLQQRDYFS